jgi:hypothetical protein
MYPARLWVCVFVSVFSSLYSWTSLTHVFLSLSLSLNSVHAAIRKEPLKARDAKKLGNNKERKTAKDAKAVFPKKFYRKIKVNFKGRVNRIRQKLLARGIDSVWKKEAKNTAGAE